MPFASLLSPRAPFRSSLALGALLFLGASGLSHADPEKPEPMDNAQAAADGQNRFALDFYGRLRAQEGNLFFSPYSISAALSMTREGARAETAAELDRALHLGPEFSAQQEALRLALRPPEITDWSESGERQQVPAYALEVANRLWGARDATFQPEFLATLKGRYAAPLDQLDFTQSDAARKVINDWVAKSTHDRIKDILAAPLPLPNTRLALANAIYFKAGWTHAFPPHATQEADWHLEGAPPSRAQLMHTAKGFRYAETDAAQLLELSYRGGATSMVVILPKGPGKLSSLEAALTPDALAGWLGQLSPEQVEVHLPRFEFTTPSLRLREQLEALGVKRAFQESRADFSGMSEEPLYIGAVVHKAFIAVDEKGTEAAAATVVMMARKGARPNPPEPKKFRADRPFLFLIRHQQTGAILFMGRLAQP